MTDKIQATHRQRRAVVYVRQSSKRQLIEHPESTRRQRALYQRALELGWPETAIEVIERDLGKSANLGGSVRTGFQHLADEVIEGRVGGIFAIEVARLARSSTEWHRLLDLCGVVDVVIVDEQTAYHPADPSDRMFLGIKGAMSEAELGWMLQRMRGALVSKARRGEIRVPEPTGYRWDHASARLTLDPDEEVQRAIRLVFERFRTERNAYRVARYFDAHGLRLPARPSGSETTVHWSSATAARVLAILHNPIYAGTYVYGRSVRRLELVDGQVVRRTRQVPVDEWLVVLHDHHPAYVAWDEFTENQRILRGNTNAMQSPEGHGAAHQGNALLQGLALCGGCGHRMQVHYSPTRPGRPRKSRYVCKTAKCRWTVIAPPIDKAVEALFLEALHPDAIALGLAVIKEVEREQAELEQQWRLRLDRARYEARLAERRYKAVDPEHRTVARNLEREWDAKLRELAQIENEYREAQARDKLDLTPADRTHIAELSTDVPQLWTSPTTTMAQRKTMLRTLVREVSLSRLGDPEHRVQVRLLWQTGAVSDVAVPAMPRRHGRGGYGCPATLEKIRALAAAGKTVALITKALNDANLRTVKGLPWTHANVHAVCRHNGVRLMHPRNSSVERRSDGAYSIGGVARRLRVTRARVRYWVEHGWLASIEGGGHGQARWFRLDHATLTRLRRMRAMHSRPRRAPTARPRPSGRAGGQRRRRPSSNPMQ